MGVGGGGGGGYSQARSTGPNGNSLCILDRQRRLPKILRDHIRSASALSALKKSLVANLSAKRQLSVAKLSAKRIFSLAKRDFLVANGRMAADFSSPVMAWFRHVLRVLEVRCLPLRHFQGLAFERSTITKM